MDVNAIQKALSDETRFNLLILLSEYDLCAGALARRLQISEAAVSQHMKIMKEAELIVGERSGNFIRYSINKDTLNEISGYFISMSKNRRKECNPDVENCSMKRRTRCDSMSGSLCPNRMNEPCGSKTCSKRRMCPLKVQVDDKNEISDNI